MLLWVMGVGFENTCPVSGKWNVPRVVIDRFVNGYMKPSDSLALVVEHSVVVMTAGSQSRRSQIVSYM